MSRRHRVRQGPLVGLAAVVLAVLVAQFAIAGGTEDPEIASLQRQIDKLRTQIANGPASAAKKKKKRARPGPRGPAGPPGSPGVQGPAGAAPACQGNGTGADGKVDAMVAAGAICIDRYEVSVWSSPTGGTQYGVSSDDYPCGDDGQDCSGANAIYARSVPGVTPSSFITWFQAQAALASVGKRLPSNAEWQQAAIGTPDDTGPATTPCNTRSGSAQSTGANAGCVSGYGVNDMVGNASEWVGDWVAAPGSPCASWGAFSDDYMCLQGSATSPTGPAALHRGGGYNTVELAGPFTLLPQNPSTPSAGVGFRGAR